MKPMSWKRFVPVLLCLSVLAVDADTPQPASDRVENRLTLEREVDGAVETPTVVYTEIPPITVRARTPQSPKGAAMRLKVVSGRTADRLDRSLMRESPKFAALRNRRSQGITPDMLDRGVPELSPKAEVSLVVSMATP